MAMLSVQLGSALSVHLISTVGPAGTAWLRLSIGALVFLALARPPLGAVRARDVPALLGLGVTTGLVTIAFLAAIERIPLGTAVAVEFLGPLTVAAVRSHSPRALTWPALALLGVVLLTEPWHGDIDPAGSVSPRSRPSAGPSTSCSPSASATASRGIGGTSLTVPIAAATAAAVGIPQAAGHLTPGSSPPLPGWRSCSRAAVRARDARAAQLTPAAFGTLMALEPAIGSCSACSCCTRSPRSPSSPASSLVVLAGAAAQRGGRRRAPAADSAPAHSELDLIG